MTMSFRTLKASIVSILGAAAAADGTFRVIGYQDQGLAAEAVADSFRTVRVYYKKGTFDRSRNSTEGPLQHDTQFAIELVSAKAAKGDLATLENPSATNAQRATALLGFQEATFEADESIDELIDKVFQVIMAADMTELGLDVGDISDRWIDEIEKTEIPSQGQFVIIGADLPLTARVVEDLTGAIPVDAEDPALTATIEDNMIDSTAADPAPAEVSGGN